MRKDYIMDISMMGLDSCLRLYENTHPCITSRLYKDPTMIISIERVDMNFEQNTIPKRREEKRREEKRRWHLYYWLHG